MTSPRADRDQSHLETVVLAFRHLIEQHFVKVDVENPDEIVEV